MKANLLRPFTEIQRAHDLVEPIFNDEMDWPEGIDSDMQTILTIAGPVLCWVLRHPRGRMYQEMIDDLEKLQRSRHKYLNPADRPDVPMTAPLLETIHRAWKVLGFAVEFLNGNRGDVIENSLAFETGAKVALAWVLGEDTKGDFAAHIKALERVQIQADLGVMKQ